jgi:hypothetical protein
MDDLFALDLGHIDAPRLRHFEMNDDDYDAFALVESLANARWPSLETLILRGPLAEDVRETIVCMMEPKRLKRCEIGG